MARPPGRDQNAPMERLVRLIGALTKHRGGAPLAVLLKVVAADDATDEARRKMLSRDLEHLNALGYDIRNVADVGSDGVYVMRARDVSNNSYPAQTTLDASGQFALNGLTAGSFMVELVKVKQGQSPADGKVVCQAGPCTLQDSSAQISDLMIKKGANVACNRPQAAYILLAGAAAAGVGAGLAGSTVPPTAAPTVTVTPTGVSGAQ